MLALLANLDPFAAGADEVGQGCVEVQCIAHLVEIRHFNLAAQAHFAAVWGQFAQNHFQERGFACAIGADQTHFVAPQNRSGEIGNDQTVAVGFAHFGELRHDLAAGRATGYIQPHAAQHLAARLAFGTQILQPRDAPLRPCAPRFHTLANPHLFLRQELVGLGGYHGLLRQLLFFLNHILVEVAGVSSEFSAIELHNAGCHPVQKRAVVCDGDHAALEVDQQVFEPGDGVQIQVVGGFVQKHHVRLGDQRLRQRHAFFHAARQGADEAGGLQVQAVQGFVDALLPVPGVERFDDGLQGVQVYARLVREVLLACGDGGCQTGADSLENSRGWVKHGLLCYVHRPQALLKLQRTVVRFFKAGEDFEQRRFARAIAANQPDAFIRFEGEISVVEQRNMAKGELGIEKRDEGHAGSIRETLDCRALAGTFGSKRPARDSLRFIRNRPPRVSRKTRCH